MKHGTVFLYPQLQFNFLITKVKILRIRIWPGHNLECYSFQTFLIIGSMPDFDTNLSSALVIDLGSGRLGWLFEYAYGVYVKCSKMF